jgi:hypothetical protein
MKTISGFKRQVGRRDSMRADAEISSPEQIPGGRPRLRVACAAYALLAFAVATAACGDSSPTSPTRTSDWIGPVTSTEPGFPPVTRAGGRVYAHTADAPYSPKGSRYVLFEDGTFVYQNTLGGETGGTFRHDSGLLFFTWFDDPAWSSAARLEDTTLVVWYNVTMRNVDFQDSVYTLGNE